MTKQEFEQWLAQHDWKRTPYGHYEKGTLRFKMSKTSVRFESFSRSSYDNKKIWFTLKSNYYKYLSITPENKLKGLKRGGLSNTFHTQARRDGAHVK